MPAPSHHTSFAGWLGAHAVPLTHLAPEAPLDDLEPLRELIGNARVVAIGENSHFITEFSLMRRRILRFLAERCGFTVLAFEYGLSDGFPPDAWAQGEGPDDDLSAHLAEAIPVGIDEPLRWMRRHNATAAAPVHFAGIDIPAAGGSLLPPWPRSPTTCAGSTPRPSRRSRAPICTPPSSTRSTASSAPRPPPWPTSQAEGPRPERWDELFGLAGRAAQSPAQARVFGHVVDDPVARGRDGSLRGE